VTLIGGQLLALLVIVALQQLLSNADLKAWGWRIPFAIGAVAALVAMFLRRTLEETASAESMQRKEAGSLRGLMPHLRAFLIVLGLTAGGSLFFYTFTTYMQKYLVNTVHMGADVASRLMTVALVIYMLMQPAFGALSDRIGRKNSVLCFAVLGAIAAVPLMTWIGEANSALAAGALIVVGLIIASFYTAVSGVVKAEMFPPEIRSLGVGLSYALANAMFGGTAEYVALWFKSAGVETYFFWYVAFMLVIATIAVLAMPDLRRRGYLDGDGSMGEGKTGAAT
jgi:MHS family alpha-ketoglutarate permease-like MFS transporter